MPLLGPPSGARLRAAAILFSAMDAHVRSRADDLPLMLYLKLGPEREPSPSDTADVPQSIDDVVRFVERYSLTSEHNSYELWASAFVGHGETPLRVERLRLGSPLEILVEIPWSVVRDGLLGGSGLWLFLASIERLWNMPKRIQVDSARLDAQKAQHERDEWLARLEALDAERHYWVQRRTYSGRFLQGEVDPPAFRGLEGRLYDQETVVPPADGDKHADTGG